MEFGYIRVGAAGEDVRERGLKERMLELLQDERLLFVDVRDKDYDRPAYERMWEIIQPGDIIYIDELDSLGRTYEDMAAEWQRLVRDWDIDVVLLSDQMPLDSRVFRAMGPAGKQTQQLVSDLLLYLGDLQRRRMQETQRDGIARAKKAGIRFGRPSIERDWELLEKTAQRWADGEIDIKQACTITGTPRSSLYQYMKDHGYVRRK